MTPARFTGHSVFLTGAAGRLGRAIAARFAAEGAALCLLDRPGQDMRALAESLSGGTNQPMLLAADLTEQGAAEQAVAQAFASPCPPDILVNCAGRYRTGRVEDQDEAAWRDAFAVNLDSAAHLCRAMARRWMAQRSGGVIVNISSAAGLYPRSGTIGYATAKAAMNAMTAALAMELGPHDIRVNAVAPGMVLDRVLTRDMALEEEFRLVMASTPLGRSGRPEDIAAAAAFLASEEADWITGAILPVTGGAHFGRPHYPVAL